MPWLVIVWTAVTLCLSQHKLQSIQNTLVRIVTNHRKYAHVTPILKQLHWLPVKYRCIFKTATLVYKFLHSGSPFYFQFLLSTHQSSSQSNILITALPLMLLRSGMNSLMMCAVQHQLPPSERSLKLTCLQKPIRHSLPCHPCVSLVLFTAVLTPKPFKTAGPTILNGRPCRLHSLGLNNACKWLSHLKWRAPALSHFNSFSSYYFVNY